MAVETAADLAAFFDTDEFAVAGTYYPQSGPSAPVTVILDQGEETISLSTGGTTGRRRIALVRASELPTNAPRDGDTLEVGGEVMLVKKGEADESGSVVTLSLASQA